MSKACFEAELVEGHKGVTVVMVPFDPAEVWGTPPVRLEGRRHGWLVSGTANGVRFDGYVGERWSRFFIIVDEELRTAAKVEPGDVLALAVDTTSSPGALERARAQSRMTTQPKKARADALDPPAASRTKRTTAKPRKRA